MTKSRLGKADSIFKPTKLTKAEAGKVNVIQLDLIRPTAGTSVENKLTVILPPGQVDHLDRLALDIRGKTGKKVKRTELIRAIIAGVMASGMDLSTLGTEDDIAAAVRDRLKR